MTVLQMKQCINNRYDTIPERQIRPGLFIKSIGREYVHILNTWGTTTIDKMSIEDFYLNYIKGGSYGMDRNIYSS